MRGVHRGQLREEWYFLVVPVDEDMTRHREDVGGATVRERKGFLSFGEGERHLASRRSAGHARVELTVTPSCVPAAPRRYTRHQHENLIQPREI
jgi:hypothetical protein